MSLPTGLRGSVLPILALSLLAGTAWSATYWVSPSGVAGRSGADSLSNSTTLAWVNANAKSGDVIRFKSGTYVDPIEPTAHVNASRLRFYGFPKDPGAVVVKAITFDAHDSTGGCGDSRNGSFTTVRWVTSASNIAFNPCLSGICVYDSVVACRLSREISLEAAFCVLDSITMNYVMTTSGDAIYIGGVPGRKAERNIIKNSTFNFTVNLPGPGVSESHLIKTGMGAYDDSLVGNTFNETIAASYGYCYGLEQYNTYGLYVAYNYWNFMVNAPIGGSNGVWAQRDSSRSSKFIGNVSTISGNGSPGNPLKFMITNSGHWTETAGWSLYDHNTFTSNQIGAGFAMIDLQDGIRYDTWQFNTFNSLTTDEVFAVHNPTAGLVFRHNTLRGGGPTVFKADVADSGSRLVGNIFYGAQPNSSTQPTIYVPAMDIDSAGVFFNPGGSAANGIKRAGTLGRPGSGGSFGNSQQTLWGSPRFADSTWANFNPQLTASTLAAGANFRDGFVGAVPFGGGSGDVTPPAVVSDLRLSQPGVSSLLVEWTAPGNDGLVGTAAAYDLRYSTSPIDASNFAFATPVLPQPVPLGAGTPQSYVALNLSAGTMYYFALRTRDAAGNWSAPGFSSGVATAADNISPAAIVDLRAQ